MQCLLACAVALGIASSSGPQSAPSFGALKALIAKLGAKQNAQFLLPKNFTMDGRGPDDAITLPANATVTIVGAGGRVVLDAAKQGRLFSVDNHAHLVLQGLVLRNGFHTTGGWWGGAIVVNSGDLTATNCTFEDNSCFNWGGAIAFMGPGNSHLSQCLFLNNAARGDEFGGAIFIDGTAAVTAVDCIFTGNTAIDDGAHRGGALAVYGGTAVLIGCEFTKPAITSPGYNDVWLCEDCYSPKWLNITFACPEGTTGAAFHVKPGSNVTADQLPPTKELVHCAAPKYLCNTGAHTCVQASSGTSLASCNASCSCKVPNNCGIHNYTTVCSHPFQGCDVCGRCCQIYIKNDRDCSGCVETECKNGHKECCK
jgi:hypothetical protein